MIAQQEHAPISQDPDIESEKAFAKRALEYGQYLTDRLNIISVGEPTIPTQGDRSDADYLEALKIAKQQVGEAILEVSDVQVSINSKPKDAEKFDKIWQLTTDKIAALRKLDDEVTTMITELSQKVDAESTAKMIESTPLPQTKEELKTVIDAVVNAELASLQEANNELMDENNKLRDEKIELLQKLVDAEKALEEAKKGVADAEPEDLTKLDEGADVPPIDDADDELVIEAADETLTADEQDAADVKEIGEISTRLAKMDLNNAESRRLLFGRLTDLQAESGIVREKAATALHEVFTELEKISKNDLTNVKALVELVWLSPDAAYQQRVVEQIHLLSQSTDEIGTEAKNALGELAKSGVLYSQEKSPFDRKDDAPEIIIVPPEENILLDNSEVDVRGKLLAADTLHDKLVGDDEKEKQSAAAAIKRLTDELTEDAKNPNSLQALAALVALIVVLPDHDVRAKYLLTLQKLGTGTDALGEQARLALLDLDEAGIRPPAEKQKPLTYAERQQIEKNISDAIVLSSPAENNKVEAMNILRKSLALDPENVDIMLLIGSISPDVEEKRAALLKVPATDEDKYKRAQRLLGYLPKPGAAEPIVAKSDAQKAADVPPVAPVAEKPAADAKTEQAPQGNWGEIADKGPVVWGLNKVFRNFPRLKAQSMPTDKSKAAAQAAPAASTEAASSTHTVAKEKVQPNTDQPVKPDADKVQTVKKVVIEEKPAAGAGEVKDGGKAKVTEATADATAVDLAKIMTDLKITQEDVDSATIPESMTSLLSVLSKMLERVGLPKTVLENQRTTILIMLKKLQKDKSVEKGYLPLLVSYQEKMTRNG